MNTKDFLFYAYIATSLQLAIVYLINSINKTRLPKGIFDFFKLSFLPYVLLNLKKLREIKEENV